MLIYLTLPIFDGTTFTFTLEDVNIHFRKWRENLITKYPQLDSVLVPELSLDNKWNIETHILQKMDWHDIAKIAEPKIPILDDAFESCFFNEYESIKIEFVDTPMGEC